MTPLLFFTGLLANAAYVRDVVKTLHENNLGPATSTQQLTIDFEKCAGPQEESLVVDLTTSNGETLPVRITCEGLFLKWESELLEIIPEQVEKTVIATCEADEVLSLVGDLVNESYKATQTIEEAVRSLFQVSLPKETTSGGGRRRIQDAMDLCLPAQDKEELPDAVYSIPPEFRCPLGSNYTKLQHLWEINITNRSGCDHTTLEWQMPKVLQVEAHPLCTGEKQTVPLEYRVAWMHNQFERSHWFAKKVGASSFLQPTFNGNTLSKFEDKTETIVQNSELSERLRQLLGVGPYDKMQACFEAQALYAWPFVHNSTYGCEDYNVTFHADTNQTVVTCVKNYSWYANSKVNTNEQWRNLFLNSQKIETLEEFTTKYVELLVGSMGVHNPSVGLAVPDTYPFEERDANYSNATFSIPVAAKRHQNLRSNTNLNTLQWQFDMPCYPEAKNNLATLRDSLSAVNTGRGCDYFRLHVDDNRCKFDPAAKHSGGFPERAFCVPHYVYTHFPDQTWNSPECVAYDETEFFCGLANSEKPGLEPKAVEITQACTGTDDYITLKQALHNSLIQMWDDTGKAKHELYQGEDIHVEFLRTFCEDGELPTLNTFDLRAYTNFSSQVITQDAECPCAFSDPAALSGMRVCPLNPWLEFGENMGMHQACVRHSGISSCMPIWSQQFARVPFENRQQGVQDRCDSQLWQKGFDGGRLQEGNPGNSNAPWAGDFEKAMIMRELYQMMALGNWILDADALIEEQPHFLHIPFAKEYVRSIVREMEARNFTGNCTDQRNFKYNYQEGLSGGTLGCRDHASKEWQKVNSVCRGRLCDYALFEILDNQCLEATTRLFAEAWEKDFGHGVYRKELVTFGSFDPSELADGANDLKKKQNEDMDLFDIRKNDHWVEPFHNFFYLHNLCRETKNCAVSAFKAKLYDRHKFDNHDGTLQHYWAVALNPDAEYTLSRRFDIERVGRLLRLYKCKRTLQNNRFLDINYDPNPARHQDQMLDQSEAVCHPNNPSHWDSPLSENQKDLLVCYALKIRGFTRGQWNFRGKTTLRDRLAPYLDIEHRNISIIRRIEDAYSKEMYGEKIDYLLEIIKKEGKEESSSFYVPFKKDGLRRKYTFKYPTELEMQKYGGPKPIQRNDANVPGEDSGGKQRNMYSKKGYYHTSEDTKCIPNHVVLEDYSSYRYNLHEVMKQNIQLGKQIEYWYSQITSEENNALMNKAQEDLDSLQEKTLSALQALRAAGSVETAAVELIEENIGAYMDIADDYLEQMESMTQTLELEREESTERLRNLDALIEEMNDGNAESLALLRATVDQMERAKDSLYGLAEGVVLTTSRTKEVVLQVQNMLFRMRRGNQDYTRHASDVLTAMAFRWTDENASSGGYHTRAGHKAYLPFVPRTPASPASSINGSLPAFREVAALPNALVGPEGVLPVAVGRGWTLQHFDSYWHLVQHRVEFACDAKALLDSPDFLAFTAETWASLLGPADCRLEQVGLPRCNACKLRLLAHACPLALGEETSGDAQEAAYHRARLEKATIYNETFVRLYLREDLEDLSSTERATLLGCRQNSTVQRMRTYSGIFSREGKTWSRGKPLARLETLSAYAQPSEGLLRRYARAYKDSYEAEQEPFFAVDPYAPAGEPTLYDVGTGEPVPAVRLFEREKLLGVSIGDRATWGQASRELCLSPREWGFKDRPSALFRGSARMVWLFSPGYHRSELQLGTSMTMDGLLAVNDWWRVFYAGLLDENSEADVSNAELSALEQLNTSFAKWDTLLCSPDFSAAKGYSDVWRNMQQVLELLSEPPSRENYALAGISDLEQVPSWLSGSSGLKHFLGKRILEAVQILPYSRLFHEIVAARSGRLPAEGITTEFFPRLRFPTVPNPVLESLHQEDSVMNDRPGEESQELLESIMKYRDNEISNAFYVRKAEEYARSAGEYETTEPTVLYEEEEPSSVEYEHTGGSRCYQSTWVSTGRHGIPLYRWKLLPGETRVQISVEPLNTSLAPSEQWREVLSGVRVAETRVPSNLLDPWREFYWLGNSSCSFNTGNPCPWPGEKTASLPFVYDIGREQIQESLSAGAKHSPLNSIRFITNQSNTYGPLLEKASHGHSPGHLFRVPLFEEVREQKYAFPLDTTSLGEDVFDATRAYSSPQQYFRPLIRSGDGLLHCVHLGDDVVANTNCRFLENMRHTHSETTAELSSHGHQEQHTFRSSALSAQRAPLGVSLEIPEDLNVRARLASSSCPYDLRVLHLFSQKVALQAFFPLPGEYSIAVDAAEGQACAGNASWRVALANSFAVLPLAKGPCHLSKVVISSKGEECLAWALVGGFNVSALVDRPPPTASQTDFAYAVYANTQNQEIVSLLADLVSADQAYSFLLQQNMLIYEDYQLRKTDLGWVVEGKNSSNGTSGLVVLNSEEARPYIQENLLKGNTSAWSAAEKAENLGGDPPTTMFDDADCAANMERILEESGVTDTESSVLAFSQATGDALAEILDGLAFYNVSVVLSQINWTDNFTASVLAVDAVLRQNIPSLFANDETPSEQQWQCLAQMAELTQEELDEIYNLVQAAIENSNVYAVAKYGPPSLLYLGTLVAAFLGPLLLTTVPLSFLRLKKKKRIFPRLVCFCVNPGRSAYSKKALLKLLAVCIVLVLLLLTGLLCLLVFF